MTVAIDKSPAIKCQRHPLDETCVNTIRSRAALAILEIVLALQESDGRRAGPLLTLPVGG